jgi:phosphate/sulfate permease
MFGLNFEMSLVLITCILAACTFEFINGFHDTANAVATVIYTKSLKPTAAVIWSGLWNFLGVAIGGIAVAVGIINLLPLTALVDQSVYHAVTMILALILTAIFWNLTTWYFGLPCSSSHTLIGSIFGVGIAFMLLPDVGNIALNWSKVKDVGLALFISPAIGFGLTLAVVTVLKKVKNTEALFEEEPKRKHPPFWTRILLILTCTSVSYSHGSNDGQKGVGLIMIILIGLIPAKFAIDSSKTPGHLYENVAGISVTLSKLDSANLSFEDKLSCQLMQKKINNIKSNINGIASFDSLKGNQSFEIRKDILIIAKESNTILTKGPDKMPLPLTIDEISSYKKNISSLKKYTEYAPFWVILMISISLGLGTMIGWKRIVVTVGEKIGKSSLTYAQGASAEFVAATTIQMASVFGLPVSTTHVLSSGVAGSMVATKGLKNLRMKTVKNILIAWLITLPVTIVLSGSLFLLLRWILS